MESNPPLIDCQTKSNTDLIFQKWAFPTNLPERKLIIYRPASKSKFKMPNLHLF
jgi:hypothetical protein